MRTKWQLSALFLGASLVCGPALGWSQQSTPSQDSGAKQDMKDAGHETKSAAKDTGHGVKKGTKKAYHSTKHGTKKAWHKTKNTTKGAVNGGKEGAKQP
jgi:Ni/Co efflux regulator RcnB